MVPMSRTNAIRFGVNIMSYREYDAALSSGYDFVIRNGNFLMDSLEGIPVLDVHYNGFYLHPKLWYGKIPFGKYLIQQIFPEKYFYRRKVTGKEDAFAQVAAIAANDFGMPEAFMEEIREHDTLLSSERNNQVVFLKAFSTFEHEDFISVIVCDKAFIWNQRSVRIILIDHSGPEKKLDGFKGILFHRIIRNYKDMSSDTDEITYDRLLDIMYHGINSGVL